MSARRWLTRLYPRLWRERYGDEFDALLDECLNSPLDVLDIFLGALDAHLELVQGTSWRIMNMVNKLRTTILLVFTAYIGFVIAGMSFYGLVDDSPAATLMKTDAPLATAWRVVQFGSVISLLAVLLGGLPIAWLVLRQVLSSSRKVLRYLLVPAFAFLALLVYGVLLVALAKGWVQIAGVLRVVTPDNFPLGNRLLLGGFMATFVLGAAASTAAVWKVVSSSEAEQATLQMPGSSVPVNLYAFALPLAAAAAASMLLMLAATLVFGFLASLALPKWFAGDYGLLLFNTRLSFAGTIALMVLSTAVAFFGLKRGYPYRKTNVSL